MQKYCKSISEIKIPTGLNLFIVDKRIQSKVSVLKSKGIFYPVQAGEKLKTLDSLSKHISKILKLTAGESRSKITIIAIGGGSVGDFSGFVASILKRGVRLIHVPSTWLSAIDSSHGGKTALNVEKVKNQIGSFYSAETTYLVKELLIHQPPERAQEAAGELIKIAMIKGGTFGKQILAVEKLDPETIWKFLPLAIKAKLDVVKRDPFETKGVRQVLNLGHTLGHVYETTQGLPHGLAVGIGLRFALFYSLEKGYLSQKKYDSILCSPVFSASQFKMVQLLSQRDVKKNLLLDKKALGSGKVSFIFISDMGKVFAQPVDIDELVRVYNNFEHFYIRA